MSIVVVAIHSGLGGFWRVSWIYPWARIAVPVFFIVSGYLFFRKYSAGDDEQKRARLKRFVKRNLQLYAFWLVVLLLPTLEIRNYFADGLLSGLFYLVRGLLFGGTFVASWYLMATVIAVWVITLLMRRLSNHAMLALFAACYVFACLTSNYWYLISGNAAVAQLMKTATYLFSAPYNNFVVALLWVFVGKMVADQEGRIRALYEQRRGRTMAWAALVLGCGLLLGEYILIRVNGWSYTNDCYFTLPLPAIALFVIVLNTEMHSRFASRFRAASTVTYCLHGTLIRYLPYVLTAVGMASSGLVTFIVTLPVCWLATLMVLKLENEQILKYAH